MLVYISDWVILTSNSFLFHGAISHPLIPAAIPPSLDSLDHLSVPCGMSSQSWIWNSKKGLSNAGYRRNFWPYLSQSWSGVGGSLSWPLSHLQFGGGIIAESHLLIPALDDFCMIFVSPIFLGTSGYYLKLVAFIEYLLCARNHARPFNYIKSFGPYSNNTTGGNTLSLFPRWRDGGSESYGMSVVTQPRSDEAQDLNPHFPWLQNSHPCHSMWKPIFAHKSV